MSQAMIRSIAVLALAALVSAARAQDQRHPANDYPTATRADYVIGCLGSNGFKREMLQKCACGIDTIADLMTFEEYQTAETVLQMQQNVAGPRASMFRNTPVATESTDKLRRAQAEVNLRCQ